VSSEARASGRDLDIVPVASSTASAISSSATSVPRPKWNRRLDQVYPALHCLRVLAMNSSRVLNSTAGRNRSGFPHISGVGIGIKDARRNAEKIARPRRTHPRPSRSPPSTASPHRHKHRETICLRGTAMLVIPRRIGPRPIACAAHTGFKTRLEVYFTHIPALAMRRASGAARCGKRVDEAGRMNSCPPRQ